MRSRHVLLRTLVICTTACIAACGWTSQETAQEWLDTIQGESSVNVSGKWAQHGTLDLQWAGPIGGIRLGPKVMLLCQEHNRVFGTLGSYEIIGALSGDRVHLAALQQGVVYYTCHLTAVPEQGAMFGKLCDGYYPEEEPHCHTITFERETPRSMQNPPDAAQRRQR